MKYLQIILILLCIHKVSNSTTIYVPTDYQTIQEGINAATVGDSVVLIPGIYSESNIEMKHGIYLLGESGDPEDVMVNATQNGSVIIFNGFFGDEATTIGAMTITSNQALDSCFGIMSENCPNIIIKNCIIKGNSSTGIISYSSNISIENNRIFDNGHIGVGCYGDNSHTVTIRNNVIYNNRNMYNGDGLAGAIFCSGIQLNLSDNLIYNNSTGVGGGLFAISCKFISASNNTIVNNQAEDFAGGIVIVLDSNNSAVIENSILWGNSIDELYIIADSGSYYDVSYCDIMGGWDGETNLDLDPEFCDTSLEDFSLKESSPCLPVNNGSGLLIGAVGYGCGTLNINDDINQLPSSFELAQNYPNPFNPLTIIEYSLPKRILVKIEIYNIIGKKVKTLIYKEKPAGFHVTTWDGTDDNEIKVASGIYLYRFQTDDFIQTKKMLMLK